MSEVFTAKVQIRKVNKGKSTQAFILVPTKSGQREQVLGAGMVNRDLADLVTRDPSKLEAAEVDYEIEGGQVKRVRRTGQAWESTAPPAPKTTGNAGWKGAPGGGQGSGAGGSHPRTVGQQPAANGPRFENPYNFIPTPERPAAGTPLGDATPLGHHRYHADHWSGRIGVTLKTKTPLLIPDAARLTRLDDLDHSVLPLRTDPNGAPYLPPTSVKGMLRSAYEAITNSRFGVFGGHDDPLALRFPAQSGAQVVPARVTNSGLTLELLPGTSQIGTDGTPSGSPPLVYAAWLPQYDTAKNYLRRNGHLAIHGQPVWAEIELWEHEICKRNSTYWTHNFDFWRVVALEPDSAAAPGVKLLGPTHVRPRADPNPNRPQSHSAPKSGVAHRWVRGWVFISNLNIDRKHDERLFFVEPGHLQASHLSYGVSKPLTDQWRALIANYQAEHAKEIAQRVTRPPALRAHCVWSRHIQGTDAERQLADGTLCYAKVKGVAGKGFEIEALYPVMISRDLYALPPSALLAPDLKPADSIAKLSPADRVFGWVKGSGGDTEGAAAFRGQLRIGPVTCQQGADAIVNLDGHDPDGLALAILGQPKPAQERFYVADDRNGAPLAKGATKGSGYANTAQGLRGRKVYPHHGTRAEQAGYWTGNLPEQEFRRLPDPEHQGRTRDTQNRSVRAWVRPDTEFCFDIHVTNLSAVELGALLWLLTLNEHHYFRLGLGKPLGFGSAHLAIASLDLRDGAALSQDYLSLCERTDRGSRIAQTTDGTLAILVDAFKQAVAGIPPNAFKTVPYIGAFLNACRGGGLPVHYPRQQPSRSETTKIYEWFVANEQGPRSSLPSLTAAERGLPYEG